MAWGFQIDRIYHRRVDIHGRFRGQQQGGIITPAQHPVVIIITGEEGLEHGYADRYRADGVFEYFGEGQVGDMRLRAGNRAIAEHSAQGKGLLLFRRTPEGLRFEGEMVCEGYHFERARDRTGAEREAIVFELGSLEAVAEKVEAEPAAPSGLEPRRASPTSFQRSQRTSQAPQKAYGTSTSGVGIRVYVLARANGKCEGCSAPAPFLRSDGTPYLEPHHLRRLKRWRPRSSSTCDCPLPELSSTGSCWCKW